MERKAAQLSLRLLLAVLGGAEGLCVLLVSIFLFHDPSLFSNFLFLGGDSVWGPCVCADTCPRPAAGGRTGGGGQHHAVGVGLGGEEEPCLRSALWTHTVICYPKSVIKISKLVPG